MTSLAINQFGGMFPRVGDQKLGSQFAQKAVNTELTSGDLVPHNSPIYTESLDPGFTAAIAYRLQPDGGPDVWKAFQARFSHIVKGPLVNDAYDRYYWTEEGDVPRYNTRARIANGDPGYRLGVPAPSAAPTVTPSGGDPALEVTRVYVYTFVTQYGEESAPSPPTVVIGNDDGTWNLSAMDTTVPNSSERPTHTKRIYRTISGQTGTTYFFVAEIALASATYADSEATDEVALRAQLQSASWNEPPSDMIGLVAHPNGFFVGFSGRNIYFSEPYRPHAWPAEYTLSTIGDIQALALFASSIGVPTTSFPYICMGSNPAAMSLIRQDSPEPCASRLGVVGTPNGVLYPSLNGLILLGPSGVQRVSSPVMQRDTWLQDYRPTQIEAAIYQAYYLAMYSDGFGFVFAFDNPNGLFSEVDGFLPLFDSIHTDAYSGQVVFLRDNEVFDWDNPLARPLNYMWKSKEFVTPKPVNMGFYRIDSENFDAQSRVIDNTDIETYNTNRMAAGPLDVLNFNVLNGTRKFDGTYNIDPAVVPTSYPQNKQPLGGSPILLPLEDARSVRVTLFANRQQVYQAIVYESGRYRFPAGYKADIFEVMFEGNARISHFKMAETGKDLGRV